MVRQYHQLNGREFEQTLGDSEGQGILGYYSHGGLTELDMTLAIEQHLEGKLSKCALADVAIYKKLLCFYTLITNYQRYEEYNPI